MPYSGLRDIGAPRLPVQQLLKLTGCSELEPQSLRHTALPGSFLLEFIGFNFSCLPPAPVRSRNSAAGFLPWFALERHNAREGIKMNLFKRIPQTFSWPTSLNRLAWVNGDSSFAIRMAGRYCCAVSTAAACQSYQRKKQAWEIASLQVSPADPLQSLMPDNTLKGLRHGAFRWCDWW